MTTDRNDADATAVPRCAAGNLPEKRHRLPKAAGERSTVRAATDGRNAAKEEAMEGKFNRAGCAWFTAVCVASGAMVERAPAGTEVAPGPATTPIPRPMVWHEAAAIRPPEGVTWKLGSAVALHQGTLAVGAARDWDLGRDHGGVRLFMRDGASWRDAGEILHPSGDTQAQFGGSLALGPGTLVVGCPRDGARGFHAGGAFVYQRRGGRWLMQSSLQRPRAMAGDLAGTSVAIDGRTLVIGVPKADEGGLDTGAVEVFELRDDAWVHVETLTAPMPQVGCFFGLSVAVDGNTILVGAPGDDSDGPISGKVHVYRRSGKTWAWDASVGCPSGPRGWFGASVAAADGVAVVGAPRAARPGSDDSLVRGAAWILQRRNGRWACQHALVPELATEGDSAGCAVATDGRTIVLGATADSLRGDMAGAAFTFTRGTGSTAWRVQRLDPASIGIASLVGHGIAVDGPWLALGRLGDPEADPAPGEVTIFEALATRPLPDTTASGAARSGAP
jgi:hypothetical protein